MATRSGGDPTERRLDSTAAAAIEDTAQISATATINPPDLRGLAACTEEARRSALDPDRGTPEPTDFSLLRSRLESARTRLPRLYRDSVVAPFISTLDQIGVADFNRILVDDPERDRLAGLMLDIAKAILQQAEGYAERATDAFEEVVSDLYDGFLSAEDRRGVLPPDQGVIPPLVKWGNPDFGPYTWTVGATATFGVQAAVVSLPPAHTRSGLLAWPALGHETAGHDILQADTGLLAELADEIQKELKPLRFGLSEYWSDRIDETASDVMGILNMGPAAGIGLVGYFRALNAAFGDEAVLRNEGPGGDPHPADILRGYLAAETVGLLSFTGHTRWAKAILDETRKDVGRIVLAGTEVTPEIAQQSAHVVARTLVKHKSKSLEQHALGDIQNWRDTDERKVRVLRKAIRTAVPLSAAISGGMYAAHAVAASVVEALAGTTEISLIFKRMLGILETMHDRNPAWGPLFVKQRGNIVRDFAYLPRRQRADSALEED